MASRFYFPFDAAAEVTPASAGGWDRISEAVNRKLATARTDLGVYHGSVIGPWTGSQKALDRYYVSDKLESQLISGDVKIQIQSQEIGSTFDAIPVLQIYVVSENGSEVRGVLLSAANWNNGNTIQSDSYGDRNTDGTTRLNGVFAKKNDRIVVAIGYMSKTGLANRCQSKFGDSTSFPDLPEDETTTTDGNPWIQFSKTIYMALPATAPNPNLFETSTDKNFSWPSYPVPFPFPGTAIPQDGVDERLLLVKPTGSPARGFTFTTMRMLDGRYQRFEWWAHRNGGCGQFRLHLREDFAEQDIAIEDGWEIHIQIRLPAEGVYRTWYRGVIRSVHAARGGNEVLTEVRGYGYIEQLNFIQVQKTYPKGMSVSDVVNDIVNAFIKPHSRIVRPRDLYPTDDSGVDVSDYQLRGDVHFECTALKAIKFLAELQGNREFGVDERRCFYFRASISTVIKNMFLERDTINMVGGGKAFDRLNQVKFQGKQFTGRELLRVRGDPTDVTNHGLFERASEIPWVTDDRDADRWADNIILRHETRESWVTLDWQGVDFWLDRSHPIGKVNFFGRDISNDRQTLTVGKIQYVKGGFDKKGEVKEIGHPVQQPALHQPVLTANVYLGAWRKDLVEELERNVYDPLAALQGKLRQFRNPDAATIFPSEGRVPGEPFALICPTEQRVHPHIWDATEWVPLQATRKGTTLPARGYWLGQTFFLITNVPSQTGTMYWWDGDSWVAHLAGGTGSVTSDEFSQFVSVTQANHSVQHEEISVLHDQFSNLNSAHNILSNRVSANSANANSVTSNELSAVSAQAASAISQLNSVASQGLSVMSQGISVVSNALSNEISNRISADDVLSKTISANMYIQMQNGDTSAVHAGQPVEPVGTYTFTPTGNGLIGVVADASIAVSATGRIQTDGTLSLTSDQWSVAIVTGGQLIAGSRYYADNGRLRRNEDVDGIPNKNRLVGIALDDLRLKLFVDPKDWTHYELQAMILNEQSDRFSAEAALGVRIDTVSNGVSVISQQVSALSQAHSVLSQAHSALSQVVSVMSTTVSQLNSVVSQGLSLASQKISVISQQVSTLSQAHSALSQLISGVSARSAGDVSVHGLQSVVNALSNRISAVTGGTGSVTSDELSAVSAQALSAINVVSGAVSLVSVALLSEISNRVSADDALSNKISAVSQALSVHSQADSVAFAALSVRVDTQSQSISVISQQVSALSQAHSALSQVVSLISQALSNEISNRQSAINVVSTTASNALSVANAASNAASIVSTAASNALSVANAASNAASVVSNALSNEISNRNSAVNVVSSALSALCAAISGVSARSVGGASTHGLQSVINALSNRISAGAGGSVTSNEVSAVSAQAASAISQLNSIVSQGLSVISQGISVVSQAASVAAAGVLGVNFDGGGGLLSADVQADLFIPFACSIINATIIGDTVGTASVEVWRDGFGSGPPTSADSITGSAPPRLSAQSAAHNSTLSGWNRSVAAESWIRFRLASVASLSRLNIVLKVKKA